MIFIYSNISYDLSIGWTQMKLQIPVSVWRAFMVHA